MDIPTSTDLILVNGEGTLHHNNKRSVNLIHDLKNIFHSNFKHIYLINATLFKNTFTLYKYFYIFEKIFVRDSASNSELSKFKIKSKLCPDLIFYSPHKFTFTDRRRGDLLITDSVDASVSNNLYKLHLNVKQSKYIPFIFKISIFKSTKYLLILIFLFIFRLNIHEKYIKNFFLLKKTDQIHQEFLSSSGVITARYHAVCLAIKTYTPFISIPSNTNKIEALLNDVKLRRRCVSLESISLEKLKVSLKFNLNEINLIRIYNSKANILQEKMFSEIFDRKA